MTIDIWARGRVGLRRERRFSGKITLSSQPRYTVQGGSCLGSWTMIGREWIAGAQGYATELCLGDAYGGRNQSVKYQDVVGVTMKRGLDEIEIVFLGSES